MRNHCTCGGTAPGYPQHEADCQLVTQWDDDGYDADHEDYMRSVLSDEHSER